MRYEVIDIDTANGKRFQVWRVNGDPCPVSHLYRSWKQAARFARRLVTLATDGTGQ